MNGDAGDLGILGLGPGDVGPGDGADVGLGVGGDAGISGADAMGILGLGQADVGPDLGMMSGEVAADTSLSSDAMTAQAIMDILGLNESNISPSDVISAPTGEEGLGEEGLAVSAPPKKSIVDSLIEKATNKAFNMLMDLNPVTSKLAYALPNPVKLGQAFAESLETGKPAESVNFPAPVSAIHPVVALGMMINTAANWTLGHEARGFSDPPTAAEIAAAYSGENNSLALFGESSPMGVTGEGPSLPSPVVDPWLDPGTGGPSQFAYRESVRNALRYSKGNWDPVTGAFTYANPYENPWNFPIPEPAKINEAQGVATGARRSLREGETPVAGTYDTGRVGEIMRRMSQYYRTQGQTGGKVRY